MSRSAVALAAAVLLLAASGCDGDSDDAPQGRGGELTADLQDVGIDLYLPELSGSRVVQVDALRPGDVYRGGTVEEPYVRIEFDGLTASEQPTWSLEERAAPPGAEGSLCEALEYDDEAYPCEEEGDHLVFTFEEDSTVAVLRGDTVLVAYLRTEERPDLADATVEALEDAPEISPEDLARG